MDPYKGALSDMTEEEVDKLFEGCHSNLDTPLFGRVYTPTCKGCKNLIWPKNYWLDPTCKVFGELPDEYWNDDKNICPHRISGGEGW